MALLGVDKAPSQLKSKDMCGKEFQIVKEAEEFYILYSRIIGFSVQNGHLCKRHDGLIKIQDSYAQKKGSMMRNM